jgi:hypothetical protein
MPSIRTLLLAIPAVSFTALFGLSSMPGYALASPAAMPFPWMTADRFHTAESQARKDAVKTSQTPPAALTRSRQPEAHTTAGRDYSPRGVYVRQSSNADPCTQMSSQAASISKQLVHHQSARGSDRITQRISGIPTLLLMAVALIHSRSTTWLPASTRIRGRVGK